MRADPFRHLLGEARLVEEVPVRATRARARMLVVVVVVGAAALANAAAALGSGGATIASAPIATPGVQQTANTVTDATVLGTSGPQDTGCWISLEYWRLPLVAGDRVLITGNSILPATNLELGVFPAGTNDSTIATTQALVHNFLNQADTVHFTAPSSGTYVLVAGPNCYQGTNGPLEFTVDVTPPTGGSAASSTSTSTKPVLALPAITSIRSTGTLTASVLSAKGSAITSSGLLVELYGSWKSGSAAASSHLLASASPVDGKAKFSFHLPAGVSGSVALHLASSAGGGYQASSSPVVRVTVG